MEWFLLFIPGVPIFALIILCIFIAIDHYSCKRRSSKLKVGDSFVYYKENPFTSGYYILKITSIWDNYVQYVIDEFDSSGSLKIPKVFNNSITLIRLQEYLDKYKAEKIDK